MTYELIGLLFLIGTIGGSISAIAGGSGLITFPALLSLGLPPTVANATNFVSVLLGNLSALPAYAREIRQYRDTAIKMVVSGCLGGALGSVLLLLTNDGQFMTLVPWLILMATLLLAFGNRARDWLSHSESPITPDSLTAYILVFIVSIYGGYFGAGLGVILLAALAFVGLKDFHEANALKNVTNSVVGILGVVIFWFNDLISWSHAIPMMLGSATGGYLGIRLAKFIPAAWLSKAVIALGFVLTVYYFLAA